MRTTTEFDASKPLSNTQHEKSVQLVALGNSQSESYIKAYKLKKNDDNARISASKLLTISNIQKRLQFLKNQNAEQDALTRAEKRQILAEFARNKTLSAKERISAIETDNKMTGDNDEGNVMPTFNINFVR